MSPYKNSTMEQVCKKVCHISFGKQGKRHKCIEASVCSLVWVSWQNPRLQTQFNRHLAISWRHRLELEVETKIWQCHTKCLDTYFIKFSLKIKRHTLQIDKLTNTLISMVARWKAARCQYELVKLFRLTLYKLHWQLLKLHT